MKNGQTRFYEISKDGKKKIISKDKIKNKNQIPFCQNNQQGKQEKEENVDYYDRKAELKYDKETMLVTNKLFDYMLLIKQYGSMKLSKETQKTFNLIAHAYLSTNQYIEDIQYLEEKGLYEKFMDKNQKLIDNKIFPEKFIKDIIKRYDKDIDIDTIVIYSCLFNYLNSLIFEAVENMYRRKGKIINSEDLRKAENKIIQSFQYLN